MRDLGVVISYTIKDMLKKKTFLISNLIILLFIVVGFNIPNILNAFSSEEEEGTPTIDKVLVVDSQNIYEGVLTKLNDMNLGHTFEIVNQEQKYEEIKQKIENEENRKVID